MEAVGKYGSLQQSTQKPSGDRGQTLSNLALIGGSAVFLLGLGLFGAVKTYLSWNHEGAVLRSDGYFRAEVIDDGVSPLIGIAPLVGGFAGAVWCGFFVVHINRHRRDPAFEGRLADYYRTTAARDEQYCFVIGLGASLVAIAYGASMLGLERATHHTSWTGPLQTYTHWHLKPGIWPKLEGAAIGVMALGGSMLAAGLVSKILLRSQRKDV
jgi:hypothetical protein